MAVLKGGILGKVIGSVGDVTFAQWKDKNYAKTKTIPANPNTEAQQQQRTKFAECVKFAKTILATVIQPYWDSFAVGVSGFNNFVTENIDSFADPIDYSTVKVAVGQLESQVLEGASYATSDVTLEWTNAPIANGLGTDKIVGVVIDTLNNVAIVSDVGTLRSANTLVIAVGEGRVAANLKAYLFAYRGTGKTLIVSTSTYLQVT